MISSSNPRIAIMGGTFNPVHLGHLIIADQALRQFDLDGVLWVPAGDPPHKALAPGASSQDRLHMVKLAIADHQQFQYSDVEIRRPGRSYALTTLEALSEQHPETEWHWILGVDALRDLPSWYGVEKVVKLCQWIIAPRVCPDQPEDVAAAVSETLPLRYQILNAPYIEISSTFIREQIQQQGSIRYLVPPSVEDYIHQKNLYRDENG
ncbi:MAG: nicotinate-nucleotide adenylyltransferase [Synechococcaceae cyanobacterium SM2_3_1]|nr:nicotinate-nucleotide adenylyltransferase [Synechococcaceae cyanobacterium SM2_3_1]